MHFLRKPTLLFHALGWLIFLSLPLLFANRGAEESFLLFVLTSWQFWLFLLVYALVFYLNFFLFIPKFLFRQRYLAYGLTFVTGLLLIGWGRPFENLIIHPDGRERPAGRFDPGNPPPDAGFQRPPGGSASDQSRPDRRMSDARPSDRRASDRRASDRPSFDIISVVLYLMLWAIGLAIAIARRSRLTERRMIQAEADKTRAELSSLKAQINPHFLFNTLNTIYTLARLNHPDCAESIMKLSNIMRYVSDEVREDFVPLEDEVECLRQYIELQELRLNKKTIVQFETSGDFARRQIPPLILMTLVENIFKHGISNREASVIEISIRAAPGEVRFYSRNRKFQNTPESGRTGIGLDNVRKRLEYLYPDRHTLTTDDSGDSFVVNLEIIVNHPSSAE